MILIKSKNYINKNKPPIIKIPENMKYIVKYTTKKSKNEKVIDAENQAAALVKTVEELSNNFGKLSKYKIIIKPLKEK